MIFGRNNSVEFLKNSVYNFREISIKKLINGHHELTDGRHQENSQLKANERIKDKHTAIRMQLNICIERGEKNSVTVRTMNLF